jgi:hypothetical protein
LRLPDNGDRISALLPNGTLYQLVLDREPVVMRYDLEGRQAAVPGRIPLVAPKGQEPLSERGWLRVATGSAGLRMGVDQRGSAWWEEGGLSGRLIEFTIEGDRASMLPPTPNLDDPRGPVRRRFDITPSRQLSFRFFTGAFDLAPQAPRARLGRGGFDIGIARTGASAEAVLSLAAVDLPRLDAWESPAGLLSLTVGFRPGGRGEVVQARYDSREHRWLEAGSLAVFPDAQTVEVADVGEDGVLAVLGMPWNIAEYDSETGLYWIPRDRPIAHLLTRVRDVHSVALREGFVALFEDEASRDRSDEAAKNVYALRAQRDALRLFRFSRPGPCGLKQVSPLGGDRFVALFCNDEVVFLEVPPLGAPSPAAQTRR